MAKTCPNWLKLVLFTQDPQSEMYNNYFSVDDRKASTENANESQEVLDKHKIKQPSLQRKQFR